MSGGGQSFTTYVQDLEQSKITSLETGLEKDKKDYVNKLQRLYDKNNEAVERIKQLDSSMQGISTKVVHLGDQLEAVHQPRVKASDTLQLMNHFDEFLRERWLNSMLFSDPEKLLESASLIQKLYSISQELSTEKYAAVQSRIADKYDVVEGLLLEEFARAQRNEKRMAEVAKVLSEFKGYNHCVHQYVQFVESHLKSNDAQLFDECLLLCKTFKPKIEKIFPNPDMVMHKLVLNLFTVRIREFIKSRLEDCKDRRDDEEYLQNECQFYNQTIKLCRQLEAEKIVTDTAFLNMLTKKIFENYLAKYVKDELDYLNASCVKILQKFYNSKKHTKKQIQAGGLQELKRDVQARLMNVENFGGETFLSEDVAIGILQETKNSLHRAAQLCEKESLPSTVESIFDILLKYLYLEHVDYAVELAISGITLAEPKTEPPPYFFPAAAQTTTIMLLLAKQYDDSIFHLLKNSMLEQVVVKKWTNALRSLEKKVNQGMRRQLNAIIGYVRYLLSTEQNRNDYRSDGEVTIQVSQACRQIVRFLNTQINAMENACDGSNLQSLETELSNKLYNLLHVHILQFTYSTSGTMLLLCDLNEYRRCVSTWRFPQQHLDTLHSLSNLLVVLPDNLVDAANSQLLANIDRSRIQEFIKLREDYRNLHINLY
ncbi:hypothetical protein WR25_27301 [Diploscapter pachys]|uniref:Exocyst complex component 5 n=1 Tax=Diploscapter pachys TaxID=2018661 RepID=A0A2A2K5X5_9BILA|nr:hypothetical protein WR25_27301 [Diploscapter pachys]